MELLSKGPLDEIKDDISILVVGDIDAIKVKDLCFDLQRLTKAKQIVSTKNIIDSINYSYIIILVEIGFTKERELIELNKKFLTQTKKALGIIVIK